MALAAVIVPIVGLPPGIPFTSQTMVALLGAQNDAVKICVCASARVAAEGESAIGLEQVIVTVALADFEVSAVLVAVTVTDAGEGMTIGAV